MDVPFPQFGMKEILQQYSDWVDQRIAEQQEAMAMEWETEEWLFSQDLQMLEQMEKEPYIMEIDDSNAPIWSIMAEFPCNFDGWGLD